jgi:hypothetical protein
MTIPLPTKPTFKFRPPSETARQAAAAQAVAAYQRGEDVKPSPVVQPAPAAPAATAETVIEIAPGIELVETPAPVQSLPGQPWSLTFERAGVIITPVTPGDPQFIDMVEAFEHGRSTPLLAEIVPLVQAIAASRTVLPISANPEIGAEGK